MKKLEKIVRNLCDKDNEQEWFEFKENWFEPVQLGEYISGLKWSLFASQAVHNLYKITTIQILTSPHNSIKIWCYGGKLLIKIHSFACKCEYCSGYGYHFKD